MDFKGRLLGLPLLLFLFQGKSTIPLLKDDNSLKQIRKNGTELEVYGQQIYSLEVRMKRNRCTEKIATQELTPLTKRILAKMGQEGAEIRRRLRHFFNERYGQRREVAR